MKIIRRCLQEILIRLYNCCSISRKRPLTRNPKKKIQKLCQNDSTLMSISLRTRTRGSISMARRWWSLMAPVLWSSPTGSVTSTKTKISCYTRPWPMPRNKKLSSKTQKLSRRSKKTQSCYRSWANDSCRSRNKWAVSSSEPQCQLTSKSDLTSAARCSILTASSWPMPHTCQSI